MRHYPHHQPMKSQELTPEFLQSQDAFLLTTDHSAYDWEYILRYAKLIIDTRNATKNRQVSRGQVVAA